MNLLQLPQCLVGRHVRDPKRVRPTETGYRGHCVGCGRPMVKDLRGWHLPEA